MKNFCLFNDPDEFSDVYFLGGIWNILIVGLIKYIYILIKISPISIFDGLIHFLSSDTTRHTKQWHPVTTLRKVVSVLMVPHCSTQYMTYVLTPVVRRDSAEHYFAGL